MFPGNPSGPKEANPALRTGRACPIEERAKDLGVSVEDLAQAAIVSLLKGSDEDFESAADRVLKKNTELYRRLA